MLDQKSKDPHPRVYQRRKRRPLLTSYTSVPSSAGIHPPLSSSSSSSQRNLQSKSSNISAPPQPPHRDFHKDFRNQFLAKVFISFTIVWTFLTFQSTEQPPLIPNIRRPTIGNISKNGNSDSKDGATMAPLLNVDGNDIQSSQSLLRGSGSYEVKSKEINTKIRNDFIDTAKKEKDGHSTIDHEPTIKNDSNVMTSKKIEKIKVPIQAAFVLVATKDLQDPIKSMSSAIESILKNTLLERILVIIPIFSHSILEQSGYQPEEVKQYFEVDLVQHHYEQTKKQWRKNKYQQSNQLNNSLNRTDDIAHIKVMIEDYDENNTQKNTTTANIYGVARSRRNAAQYINHLYEERVNHAKVKQEQDLYVEQIPQEEPNDDVILTFLRPDSQIENSDWLDIATHALQGIIPTTTTSSSSSLSTPTYKQTNEQESFHFQNAVSFTLSQKTKKKQHMNDRKNKYHPHYHHFYSHQYLFDHKKDPHHFSKSKHTTTSLDINLTPIHTSTPLDADVKLTKGKAFPTPILEGSATSLLLSTFLGLNANLNIAMSDKYVTSTIAADIELSLNLWLCGSGIDVLTDLHVEKDVVLLQNERDKITNEEKVWLTREWMADDETNRYSFNVNDHKVLGGPNFSSMSIGDKILMRLNHTGAFNGTQYDQILLDIIQDPKYNAQGPHQLEKCRTFEWYTKEVNMMMGKQLQMFDRYIGEVEKINPTKINY